MSSPTFTSLRQTLKHIRRRHSRLFLLQQASLAAIALAILLLAMSVAEAGLNPGRNGSIALFFITLTGIALILWRLIHVLRIKRADDQHLARYVEDHIPDLEQRLLTSLEFSEDELQNGRKGVSSQFIHQLWQDAQEHVARQQQAVETVIPARKSWMSFGYASGVVAVIAILFASSETLLQAGGKLVWPFAIAVPEPVVPPVQLPVSIEVEPGDLELQRGSSVTIIAQVNNARPASVNLRIQDDNVNWRDYTMSLDGSGSDSASYSYFIPALEEDVTYYITFTEGSEFSSEQFEIDLFDLPQVEQVSVAFEYPDYTGIPDEVVEDGGDMVVPEGTVVDLNISFNKAIASASLEFDPAYDEEGTELRHYDNQELSIDGSNGTARFTVSADGVYRIRARDFDGLESSNPLDYFIRAIEDKPPELVLKRPGKDEEVMPLEEVVLEVEANDDYGLSRFTLNYSVVGSDEVGVDFLSEPDVRSVAGSELIYLEDLGVEPGDFVSYYLTLADNNGLRGPAEVISDIYFLQVIPTDQEFRRSSQQGGGGGGGGQQGGDSSALVTIQKDIIAATWKLRNRQSQVSPDEFNADAQIIAQSQRDATERARMSIDRLAERLNFSDDTYDSAVQNLSQAIEQMNLAAVELDKQQVTSALTPEQTALQYILKAEAAINRTNVAMQQGGGGGGGGGAQQEREDLRELFEMELGRLENRYETPNSAGGGGQQNTEEANKLEELARRQEGLTRAQRNLARREDQMTEEQKRRELERLMRQQEQLSREVAQLSQQLSRSQQGAQSSSQSQSQSQSSSQASGQQQSGSGASSSGQQQQDQNQLQRAAEQMRQAAESDDAAIAAALSQKALENLREQQRAMNQQTESSVNQLAQNLSQRGQQLLQQQRKLQQDLASTSRQQGLGQTRQSVREDEQLQSLIEDQQRQQRELKEIDDMLRAIVARGDNEDQRLMSQAQSASRDLRPIQEQMQTSSRVLRNGMVNLAVDIESEIEDQIEALSRSLAALNPSAQQTPSDRIQQAALDAAQLAEQVRQLEQQVQQFNQGGQAADNSVRQMREQLARSQQLAQQLTDQLQEQQNQPGQAQGGRQQQPGSQQPGNQQARSGQQGGGQQQAGGNQPGGNEPSGNQAGGGQTVADGRGANGDNRLGGGVIDTSGNNSPWGNARSIRQQLTQQDIEDFLNQPDLFTQLLQPILELEGQLRARAELDRINNKLYAAADEDVPEEYRQLVEQYYRVLSENQGNAETAR